MEHLPPGHQGRDVLLRITKEPEVKFSKTFKIKVLKKFLLSLDTSKMCSVVSTNSENERQIAYGKQLCVHLIGTKLQRNSNLGV